MTDTQARIESKRRYSAEDTKTVLMLHAERAFTADGYDDVGVRDIAAAAGVNPSLVNRYFGGKQGLFEAVLESIPDTSELLADDQAHWGSTLARMMVAKIGTVPDVDPLLILLRSAQSKTVGDLVHQMIERRTIAPLARHYGNTPRAKAKARLGLSVILGVDVIERLISLPHSPEAIADFEDILAKTLQAIIDA